MENKVIHASPELERAVLGHVLLTKSLNGVFGYITPKDFTDKRNEMIFQALTELQQGGGFGENGLELAALVSILKDKKQLEKVGGHEYIASLIDEAALPANITKFIKTIENKSRLRKFTSDIESIQSKLQNPGVTPDQMLDTVENQVLSSIRDVEIKGFEASDVISSRAYSIIEKKASGQAPSGIKSDFADIDALTGGFQKGDLVILAARPSMGKTALALNLMANVAHRGEAVAFFSVEMGADQIWNRLFAFKGLIDAAKLRDPKFMTPTDWKKLDLAHELTSKYKLFIDDTAGIKIMDLVWKAKALHKNHPLSLIVIDYLQLITTGDTSGGDNRQNEVSMISRTLKKLARELGVPVIALSQLSRKVEMRESKVPMMSDLRESGAIEQDADLIAFVYREDYYKSPEEKAKSNEMNNGLQKTQVIVGKHRNGATDTIDLTFNPSYGLFSDKPKRGSN